MSYEKLVRDNIPDIIRRDNGTPITRNVASLEEYETALREKLWEEVGEFLDERDLERRTREAADVLEVLFAFFKLKHIPKDGVLGGVGQVTERLLPGISDLHIRLYEEVDALANADDREEFIGRSIRVIRCVRDIMHRYEIELDAILTVQRTLHETRGGFEKGIMLTMQDLERPA